MKRNTLAEEEHGEVENDGRMVEGVEKPPEECPGAELELRPLSRPPGIQCGISFTRVGTQRSVDEPKRYRLHWSEYQVVGHEQERVEERKSSKAIEPRVEELHNDEGRGKISVLCAIAVPELARVGSKFWGKGPEHGEKFSFYRNLFRRKFKW